MDGNNRTDTFNPFWKHIEGNGIQNNSVKSDWLTNFQQKTLENEGNREGNDENNNISLMDNNEVKGAQSAKVLEV